VLQLEKPVTAKQLRASVLQVVHATSKAPTVASVETPGMHP
jgi:hypothetical protein